MKNVFNGTEYPYKSELQEPLKSPEDIIEAVEESKHSGDHTEIHNILKDRKINLSTHFFLIVEIPVTTSFQEHLLKRRSMGPIRKERY